MRKYQIWSGAEIKQVKEGKIPEGREYRETQQFCQRNRIKFPGIRLQRFNAEMEGNTKFCTRCHKAVDGLYGFWKEIFGKKTYCPLCSACYDRRVKALKLINDVKEKMEQK